MSIKLIHISSLKVHEQIIPDHVAELKKTIEQDNAIYEPVIVDRQTMIVLDGHHRVTVAKELGLTHIPALLVDYNSDQIRVKSWRPEITVSKQMVIQAGLTGQLLQPKTSRHIIPFKPTSEPYPLPLLRSGKEHQPDKTS